VGGTAGLTLSRAHAHVLSRLGPVGSTVLVITALIVVAIGVSVVVPLPPAVGMLIDPWGNCAVFAGGATLCTLRAWRDRAQRAAWAALGAGLLSYGTGNVVFAMMLLQGTPPPYPSMADAFWLTYFPLTYLGIALMWRQRIHRFHLSMVLDALVAAFGVAALAWVLAYGHLIGTSRGSTSIVLTNLAYPVADLLLVAVVVGAASALGVWSHRALNLVAVGLLTFAVADTLYAMQVAAGTYQPGGFLNTLWPIAALLTGVAAACPAPDETQASGAGRWRMILLPVLFAAVSLSVLGFGLFYQLSTGAGVLSIASLVAATLRASLAFRQVSTLAETRRQARTDELTGLHNRRAFMADLEQALERRETDESVGVLLIDLDRFKEVNDALGHHVGDALLQMVTARLGDCLGSEDVLARLGGDEFAIMLPGVPDEDAAATLAHRMQDQLRDPFQLPDITLHVGASVGIAMCPLHAEDGPTLLQKADVAMYDAKVHGGEFRFYSPERDKHSKDRLQTIEQLRSALGAGQLVLHYQPLIDLTTDRVVGVEALVRWNHPSLGLLGPDHFLPLAEQTGLMRPLCEYVLDEALAQISQWRRSGWQLRMSVNVSTSNLLDARLPEIVASLLASHAVPAKALILEVTESTIMADPVRAQSVVGRLDALGVQVAVDDYGTGYSSLAYLRDLAVRTLKLDKSFLKDLIHDPRATAIVRSTTDLAHALGMSIVAEGVEEANHVMMLRRFGCDLAQGFLYSRPLPTVEFLEWLRDREGAPIRHLRALGSAG
jgi:diguanylate cyclase (GGDEF)-like protein